MYRIGLPMWKLAANIGIPLKLRVYVFHDKEANVYVATSRDLPGLVAEAATVDQLIEEVNSSAEELLHAALHAPVPHRPTTDLRFCPA